MTQAIAPPTSQTIPSSDVISALLAGVVKVRRRCEIYESDGETPFEIADSDSRMVDGSVNVDRTRDERRVVDISLENKDGALKIDPFGGFWYDKILKVFWGINYYDSLGLPQAYDVQIGEFMIDGISEKRFPRVVKVVGRDYTKKCLTSKIKTSMQFPAGIPVEDIIRAVAANAGIKKFALPHTGQTYTQNIVFERFTERWKVIQKLADSIGYEVYFRGDGYLTMRPYPDPYTSPVNWTFTGGAPLGSLVDWERSSNDSLIKNHIIVVGATSTDGDLSTTVFAEVSNTDPQSPTNVERIGDRVDSIENDYFTDNETALAFAQQKLKIGSLEQYEINFQSLIIPWLEGSDIVDIDTTGGSNYVPTRFMLSNFAFPLTLGAMSGTAKRVTIIDSNQRLEFE